MRKDSLQVDPASYPELLAAPRVWGSFRPLHVEDRRIALVAQASQTAALAYAVGALGVLSAAVLLLVPLGLAVWSPLGALALVLAGWLLLRAARELSPPTLVIDEDRREVRGVPDTTLALRPVIVPLEAVDAVTLTVAQVRPSSGSGQHSLAWLELTRTAPAPGLRGPRSEERALASWAEARDQLVPLGLELARRLGCPLRLRYQGWPDTQGPIQREISPAPRT